MESAKKKKKHKSNKNYETKHERVYIYTNMVRMKLETNNEIK